MALRWVRQLAVMHPLQVNQQVYMKKPEWLRGTGPGSCTGKGPTSALSSWQEASGVGGGGSFLTYAHCLRNMHPSPRITWFQGGGFGLPCWCVSFRHIILGTVWWGSLPPVSHNQRWEVYSNLHIMWYQHITVSWGKVLHLSCDLREITDVLSASILNVWKQKCPRHSPAADLFSHVWHQAPSKETSI